MSRLYLALPKGIVFKKKKANNQENEQYPLIFKQKKKVLVPNYTVPDQYFKALIFSLFKTEVFLSFGS